MIGLKRKKADERVLSVYWIIIFVLIAISIVSATIIFFSSPADVRQIEARVLGDKLIECLAENGQSNQGVFNSLSVDGSNLEQKCSLNLKDASYDKNQFYIKIKTGAKDGAKEIIYNQDESEDYAVYCKAEINEKNVPVCYEQKLFVLNEKNEFILIDLLIAINKIKSNVK